MSLGPAVFFSDRKGLTVIEARCEACGAVWTAPDSLDREVVGEIAEAFRSHGGIGGIKAVRDRWGISLHDAKAFMLHLVTERGKCHRCKAALGPDCVCVCRRCRSVNYNW